MRISKDFQYFKPSQSIPLNQTNEFPLAKETKNQQYFTEFPHLAKKN